MILPGFEDLRPHDVLSFNSDGTVTVVVGERIMRYQMQMNPNGSFSGHAIEQVDPDQVQERKQLPVALRWAATDQGASALMRGEKLK